jgi:stage II sporulation protein D
MKQYILLFVLLLGSAGYGIAYNANQAMEEADTYLRNGQYLEAEGAYQNIADFSSDPEIKAGAILMIGDIYSYFLNNYDLALDKYSVVIKKYGSSKHAANAYFNSGMILYEKYCYKEALNQFKIYLKKYPHGDRREITEFMIETCSRPSPSIKEKRTVFKAAKDEIVRVLIMTGVREIRVDSPSLFEVRDGDEKSILIKVQTATIDISGGGIRVNDNHMSHEEIVIVPSNGNMLSLKSDSYRGKFKLQKSTENKFVTVPSDVEILNLRGDPYRGKIKLQKNAGGGMDVISVLDVEDYLYGVVPKEMSPQWHPEALKAQTVAARTYALYQKGKNRNRDYDIIATTTSQIYGGAGVESERSNQAVDETKGMVILYKGQLALTYYHANSGGMTEDAKRVWNADVPYLKAVQDDYSMKAPNCSWKLSLNIDKIRRMFNNKGIEIGPIDMIVPIEISPSGRVMRIKVFHGGKETVLNGNDFRTKIDPALVKSTMFAMTNEGHEIHFEGRGYGHGVGMSQWGAYIMAHEGYSYKDILKHYYHGIELK